MKEPADVSDLLHARVFKSILLQSHIRECESKGVLVASPPSTDAEPFLGTFGEFFEQNLRERANKMTYVYGLFYCFENLVRELVSKILEEQKGPSWWESVPIKVKERVEKRKADVAANAWHQAVFNSNIDHTLFGDLSSIIVEHWQVFEDLFPSQPWVKQRLDELERSRNVIAHGNVLADAEIERIEQYLGDWVRQVP